MKIPVDRLFGSDVEAIEVNQTVRPGGDVGARYPDGVNVVATIGRITHGVHMEGFVEGVETETCVRCLEEFKRATRVALAETFSEDVAPKDALFSDVSPLVNRTIDLDDLVTQLLEIDEPMAAVCDEACMGICPVCGGNRNVADCSCEASVKDERMAGLARLIQERDRN